MKKLYCTVLLLVSISSMYGMQKKTKSSKKFNIHNTQHKNSKKNKNQTKQKYNRWVEEKLDKKLDTTNFVQRCVKHRNCMPSLTLAAFVVVWFSPIVILTYDPRCASINWSAVIKC